MNKYKVKTDRMYFIEKLQRDLPSVTTILGLIDKSGPLMGWAINSMRTYAGQKFYKAVEQQTKLSFELVDLILDEAASNYRKISQDALDVGSMVHNLIEVYLKGQNVEGILANTPELVPSFNAFKAWATSVDFKCIESEHIIWSELGYAGTLDAVGLVNGKLYIVDFKTSKAIYDEYILQVAAYLHAYVERSGKKIEGAGILRIAKDGSGEHEWREISLDELKVAFEAFKYLLGYWQVNQKRKDSYGKRTRVKKVVEGQFEVFKP